MADPFELVLGGGLSDTDKQKLIANALRNRKQVGDIAMLTGDDKLGAFGKVLNEDVGKSESEALGVRGSEQQRQLTGDYYKQLAAQAGLSQAMATRKQNEEERHNKESERIAELNALRARQGAANVDANNVRRLSEHMTSAGIPQLKDAVGNVTGLMKEAGGDLPGVGATGVLPQFMLTKKGQQMRQGFASVRNQLLKTRSGSAVTDNESARLAEELGAMSTDEAMMTAWPRVVAQVEAIERSIKAGYDDDVVNTFDQRNTRGAAQAAPAPTGGAKVVKWGDLSGRRTP